MLFLSARNTFYEVPTHYDANYYQPSIFGEAIKSPLCIWKAGRLPFVVYGGGVRLAHVML
jgi:hypothetical protein